MSAPTKDFKRLIVLCDGTAQDSTSGVTTAYPTNVTRISRAISREASLQGDIKAQQIIYYQPGVGTGPTDKLTGGVYGEGVSANVRGAYGFLAHNYDDGDEIVFFGFSRGAYTARAIAGLVTYMGLLTKRGMDSFPEVYNAYYKHDTDQTKPSLPPDLVAKLKANNDLNEGAKKAIKIIGLWDTVGFHGTFGGEKLELWNELLSPDVQHGYHALALDEERLAFKPTLWDPPSDPKQISQVWFSGAHSDVGGGNTDHHLSDISLMWMIAKCAEDNKLEFDLKYYLLDNTKPEPQPAGSPWNTAMGVGKGNPGSGLMASAISVVTHTIEGQGLGVRSPMPKPGAQEAIHVSIHSRNLKQWPCKPLAGPVGQNQWALKAKPDARLTDAPLDAAGIELDYKGRVRAAPVATQKRKSFLSRMCVIF